MAQRKRKLLDDMPADVATSSATASAVSRHANRRSLDEATKRAIQEHFPSMSELYMTQHKVDGATIVDRVTAAKVQAKKTKGKLGSAFWRDLRAQYHDAGTTTPDLKVKDINQEVSETLVKAITQARTANCTKRSQAALISWLQTAESVNQKEFVGIARHVLTLRPNSNQVEPRAKTHTDVRSQISDVRCQISDVRCQI